MPKALRVLEEKLDANDPDSWRSAVKLIEYGWGRPAEQLEVRTDMPVYEMSLEQLRTLRSRLLAEHPQLARLTVE
jgi:hypothetical protein